MAVDVTGGRSVDIERLSEDLKQLRGGEADELVEGSGTPEVEQGGVPHVFAQDDAQALLQLVSKSRAKDADVRALRQLLSDHHRARMHAALDVMIDRVHGRRCTGDREFLRKCGVKP